MTTFREPVNLPSQWHTSDYEGASVGWVKRFVAQYGGGGGVGLSGAVWYALDGLRAPNLGETFEHNLGTTHPLAFVRRSSPNNDYSNGSGWFKGVDSHGASPLVMIEVWDENTIRVRYRPILGYGYYLYIMKPTDEETVGG